MRAGAGRSLEDAQKLMQEAADWHDEHYSCVKKIRHLIIWKRLNNRLIDDLRASGSLSAEDVIRLRYLMGRQDWIDDMRIFYEENLNTAWAQLRHYEFEAQKVWEKAERRNRIDENQD